MADMSEEKITQEDDLNNEEKADPQVEKETTEPTEIKETQDEESKSPHKESSNETASNEEIKDLPEKDQEDDKSPAEEEEHNEIIPDSNDPQEKNDDVASEEMKDSPKHIKDSPEEIDDSKEEKANENEEIASASPRDEKKVNKEEEESPEEVAESKTPVVQEEEGVGVKKNEADPQLEEEKAKELTEQEKGVEEDDPQVEELKEQEKGVKEDDANLKVEKVEELKEQEKDCIVPVEDKGIVNEQSIETMPIEMERSVVEEAKPGDVFTKDPKEISQPLVLSWSFGYNSTLPVHNTSYSDKKMVFYICNQTGVLYDCINHKQHLLQGHGNPITCSDVSGDKRWLVTADIGYTPLLIVWDSYSAIPVRTFFDGLGQGTIAVAISHDSKYVATIGITMPQVVSVWDWTDQRDMPLYTTSLSPERGLQTYIVFCQSDSSLLVSNSEDNVIFYKWDQNGPKNHTTPLTEKDFNKSIGYLSQTVFIPNNSHFAVTVTSVGYGVVWETTGLHRDGIDRSTLQTHCKSPSKLMVLHDSPISTLTIHQSYIVTGDMEGQIKFFDENLTLVNWYDRLNCGPIVSISFAFNTTLSKLTKVSHYPPQSTLEADPHVVPDFVVSSATATIRHVISNGTIQDTIIDDSESGIPCMSTHPTDGHIAIASNNGTIKLWNYEHKFVIVARTFSCKSSITSIQFAQNGEFIGIGFSNGEVRVICAVTLEDRSSPFNYSSEPITHIAFSTDGSPTMYMATAGGDLTTSVFVLDRSWRFLARHKAHYKKIQSLVFGAFPDTGLPRLLSLSEDRHIVEYDLANSSTDDLKLLSVDRIEQSAVPTAVTWYPPLSKESFLLTANNQYKLKLYNSSTKMCRKTLLGPTFGSPLKKIAVLPAPPGGVDNNRRYLAYVTKEKVGLIILPHNGNPHNTMCLIAHSGQVSDLATSYDGRFVFTAGGEDCSVNMWSVNTNALNLSSQLGGPDLEPFYRLIEGGREGEFFAELEQFFYYAQMRSQGLDTVDSLKTSLAIPLEQTPFVMRAIGFYPSELEIENMLNEVKFSCYADTGEFVLNIDLEDFIKLYINHRPVHGLTPGLFAIAIKNLGQMDFESKQWKIDRSHLLSMLQERGEHMTEIELVEHLMTLLGYCENPEKEGEYSDDPESALLNELPELISAQEFVEDIAGLST